ncbi:MAG: hypothetical protein IT177_09690 [Acidobacteria bacterium]|nr:hypothetical protein [Acidobacteriota bacterium]
MTTRRDPTPWRLPESEWDSVGIYRHRPSGIPTHISRGDGHASDIIAGRYPLAQAQADEQRRRALVTQIAWARRADRPLTGADVLRRRTGED